MLILKAVTKTRGLAADWSPIAKEFKANRSLAVGSTVYFRSAWPGDSSPKSYIAAASLLSKGARGSGYAVYQSLERAIEGGTWSDYSPVGYQTQETYDDGMFFFDFVEEIAVKRTPEGTDVQESKPRIEPGAKLTLKVARNESLFWAQQQVQRSHYLHTIPDPRCRSLVYVVFLGTWPVGCLYFGRPQANRCYQGELTYGSLEDMNAGRAIYDRWEVLDLSRVWLSPEVQRGGAYHSPDFLPGFTDRKGVFRSRLASTMVHAGLQRINYDYLHANPPCFVEQPYKIRAVLSYCDTRVHRGVIYRESDFALARTNKDGIQTWWTADVKDLTSEEDKRVRDRAATHPRSIRIRERGKLPLFDSMDGVAS